MVCCAAWKKNRKNLFLFFKASCSLKCTSAFLNTEVFYIYIHNVINLIWRSLGDFSNPLILHASGRDVILIHLTPFYELRYWADKSVEVKCRPVENHSKTLVSVYLIYSLFLKKKKFPRDRTRDAARWLRSLHAQVLFFVKMIAYVQYKISFTWQICFSFFILPHTLL